MPIIQIINWPSEVASLTNWKQTSARSFEDLVYADNKLTTELAQNLRRAAIAAEIPGINSVDLVTVSFDRGRPIAEDKTICVLVFGLFDRPDRTKVHRDRLGEVLKTCVEARWQDQRVEVFVKPFDPAKETYT